MLSITMRHTGELYLTAPTCDFPLNRRLVLTVGNETETAPEVLLALDEAMLNMMHGFTTHIDLIDTRGAFGERFNFEVPESPTLDYMSHLLRVEVANALMSKIQNMLVEQLRGKGVTSFEIVET